ncbi:MAG: hypothetical protein ABIA21_02065 [Candidatus Aenigmatarchaeota archaeon]
MKHSLKVGFSFGLTSGVITTLGLLVGLSFSTNSKLAVLGGIITIAVADAFSDSMGIHVSEESENKHTSREIWEATLATFASKFLFAMTFIIPVLLFDLHMAVIISVVWGMLVLGIASFKMARSEGLKPWKVIGEHLLITSVVVVVAVLLGEWINSIFV